jgi:hypothetical protein
MLLCDYSTDCKMLLCDYTTDCKMLLCDYTTDCKMLLCDYTTHGNSWKSKYKMKVSYNYNTMQRRT